MLKKSLVLVFLLLFLDQLFKIWIKTHFRIGESIDVMGFSWFQLYFIENRGFAFGWELMGNHGKLLLSIFRMLAIAGIAFYLVSLVRKQVHKGLILTIALILAGASGNLIDSAFYGLIFTESTRAEVATLFPHGAGYAGFLQAKVVDMLYFPVIQTHWPGWVPKKGGDELIFFRPIFNLADSYISIGVGLLIVFQRRFFAKPVQTATAETGTAGVAPADSSTETPVGDRTKD